MLKAVIFDMDGVIIDSEPVNFAIEQEIFSGLGILVSKEEHQSYVGTTDETMWEAIKQRHGLKQTVKELQEIGRKKYMEYIRSQKSLKGLKALPGIVELLEDLSVHGVLSVLASSATYEKITAILNHLNITEYFASIVSGDDVASGKPAPDIFLEAVRQICISVDECLVIEDSQNGVQAAKAAGMKCLGFRNINSGNQDLSEAGNIIDNFKDLNYKKICHFFTLPRNCIEAETLFSQPSCGLDQS